MEGIFLRMVLSATRHSRARGNVGLFRRISLDARVRGYDGLVLLCSTDHPTTCIFKGDHKGLNIC